MKIRKIEKKSKNLKKKKHRSGRQWTTFDFLVFCFVLVTLHDAPTLFLYVAKHIFEWKKKFEEKCVLKAVECWNYMRNYIKFRFFKKNSKNLKKIKKFAAKSRILFYELNFSFCTIEILNQQAFLDVIYHYTSPFSLVTQKKCLFSPKNGTKNC